MDHRTGRCLIAHANFSRLNNGDDHTEKPNDWGKNLNDDHLDEKCGILMEGEMIKN